MPPVQVPRRTGLHTMRPSGTKSTDFEEAQHYECGSISNQYCVLLWGLFGAMSGRRSGPGRAGMGRALAPPSAIGPSAVQSESVRSVGPATTRPGRVWPAKARQARASQVNRRGAGGGGGGVGWGCGGVTSCACSSNRGCRLSSGKNAHARAMAVSHTRRPDGTAPPPSYSAGSQLEVDET
jgi:hypothetical protein